MSQLIPMTQSVYEEYLKHLIPDYAADNVRAGYWDETEALEKSRKQIESLLPQGLETKDHYIFTLVDGDQVVGMIWLKAELSRAVRSGFIFDVMVDEKFRGKGYGKEVMRLIEEKARELELKSIGLHVFAYNDVAKHIYESVGYQISSLNMIKKL
jgi:RimJ/RimL family protein N-acetyltransferase